MPELPEVETIKLQLGRFLTGHKIESVQVNYAKKFDGNIHDLIGKRVIATRRFGKVVCIDLEENVSILAHVKMTGQFIYRGPNLTQPGELSRKVIGGIPGKHTHIIFKLDNQGVLYFNDVRKFGWLKIIPTSDVEKDKFVAKLGPEPLKDLTLEKFKRLLSKSSRPIKIVIMDQAKMGGVGNIYANDALWLAKINPKTPANNLKTENIKDLYKAINNVLKEGIKWGGASELAFVTPDGREGDYQSHSLAYAHEKELCPRCKKGIFEKYFLGGRGTYYCSICQK